MMDSKHCSFMVLFLKGDIAGYFIDNYKNDIIEMENFVLFMKEMLLKKFDRYNSIDELFFINIITNETNLNTLINKSKIVYNNLLQTNNFNDSYHIFGGIKYTRIMEINNDTNSYLFVKFDTETNQCLGIKHLYLNNVNLAKEYLSFLITDNILQNVYKNSDTKHSIILGFTEKSNNNKVDYNNIYEWYKKQNTTLKSSFINFVNN